MKKNKLNGIIAAAGLLVAGIVGITTIGSDAKAAGNLQDNHSATAQISTYGGGADCSAVWVGPQAVLTATHCVGNANSGEIHVFSDNMVSKADTWENRAEIAWQAPGNVDITLLHTPNMSVKNYAPISATAPKIGKKGQVCGMNKVSDSHEVLSRGGDNYCGNVTFKKVQEYKAGNQSWGKLIFTQPSVVAPGDSGGPVYDADGTVQGVAALYWIADNVNSIRLTERWLLDANGFTPTYLYVNELRAHGAVVKGEAPTQNTLIGPAVPAYVPDGNYVITSALNNNKALDVNAASKLSGANVQLWDRNNSKAQVFKVTHLGDGQYSIVNVNSGK